jgi:hypothetical protein
LEKTINKKIINKNSLKNLSEFFILQNMNTTEGDLVMLRLETKYGYSNTWWRVMFVDNDNTFIGRLERSHWIEYDSHQKGSDVRWSLCDIKRIYKGEQFCYGDNITICECRALCRNK